MGKDRGDIMHKVWKPDRTVLLETRNSCIGGCGGNEAKEQGLSHEGP